LAGSRLPALRLVIDTWGGALLEVTRDGDSLMHTACRASSPPILKYLLHIGISTNILNHKGMKPHQCLPKRPRKSNPKKSILGVDRTTIMNCLVQITKARRSWNPQTHQLFPPEFRSVSKMLAMYSLRLERKLVVHYRENNPAYLREFFFFFSGGGPLMHSCHLNKFFLVFLSSCFLVSLFPCRFTLSTHLEIFGPQLV
jgi:hypothetical protein